MPLRWTTANYVTACSVMARNFVITFACAAVRLLDTYIWILSHLDGCMNGFRCHYTDAAIVAVTTSFSSSFSLHPPVSIFFFAKLFSLSTTASLFLLLFLVCSALFTQKYGTGPWRAAK
jgi:hypothetical protein